MQTLKSRLSLILFCDQRLQHCTGQPEKGQDARNRNINADWNTDSAEEFKYKQGGNGHRKYEGEI